MKQIPLREFTFYVSFKWYILHSVISSANKNATQDSSSKFTFLSATKKKTVKLVHSSKVSTNHCTIKKNMDPGTAGSDTQVPVSFNHSE